MGRSISESCPKEKPVERQALLVLDFDGVLCDSLPECFASSWYAYYELCLGRAPDSVPRDAYALFAGLRPLIRSGEDYLLIQDLLRRGESVSTQAEFDLRLSDAGAELMARYKTLLYQARDHLLSTMPEYWCRLNPIYPHLRGSLERMDPERGVFILSTKRAPFIARILAASGLRFPDARVLYTGGRRKAEIIFELLDAAAAPGAVFIDDQIDHFAGSRTWPRDRRTVDCRLASWGYVRPEWLRESPDYRVIGPEEAQALLERYAR
jgi:phosphoglycolate phosphatase-like HAD superfamily hydrolase